MAATERNSQTTWLLASLGARRVTKVMPMPESTNTIGSMAGSAPGASRLMARCATAKAAKSPMGTPSVARLSSTLAFTTYIA